MKFNQFNLKQEILNAIDEIGFKEPSPIQVEAIPLVLDGCDIVAQAQTGTGKTAAFGLPLINKMDSNQKTVQILVIVPTRELAMQVSDELYRFGKYLKMIAYDSKYSKFFLGVPGILLLIGGVIVIV
jgi:ATP-dependent RNA helicase DeaD